MIKKREMTIEGIALKNCEKGASFYTSKEPKHITALANYYNRKVETEKIVALNSQLLDKITKLTKVTIIN